jgi:hypothetical protein
MSTTDDALDQPLEAERLFYATGILLDKDAFQAEQDYHRGRLAHLLALGAGAGTLSGLKVSYQAQAANQIEEVKVSAGFALDRIGRLVEVRADACIRLDTWFGGLLPNQVAVYSAAQVTTALALTTPATVTCVVADVFLRFAVCERGKTPAFATGPYDSIDAVAPSRLRDAYELKLVPRAEAVPPQLPQSRWDLTGITDPAQRIKKIQELIVAGTSLDPAVDNVFLPASFAEFKNGVFLARVAIPATAVAGARPDRINSAVLLGEPRRPFVYSTGALAALLGVLP